MADYVGKLDDMHDIGAILRYVRDCCQKHGVQRMSYHVAPIFAEPTSLSAAVYADGFSEEWLDLYERSDFRANDPIPSRVMRHGAMMTWKEAMKAGANTPENLAYFDAMREHELEHGFGLPLFGPHGRDAYASFDFGEPIDEVDEENLNVVRAVAQMGHQRICVLLEDESEIPQLSERELEVLQWIARGKSISSVATILDLSPDTVKTYSRRIYAKLDATDRVGAVVKALRLGLVRL